MTQGEQAGLPHMEMPQGELVVPGEVRERLEVHICGQKTPLARPKEGLSSKEMKQGENKGCHFDEIV